MDDESNRIVAIAVMIILGTVIGAAIADLIVIVGVTLFVITKIFR